MRSGEMYIPHTVFRPFGSKLLLCQKNTSKDLHIFVSLTAGPSAWTQTVLWFVVLLVPELSQKPQPAHFSLNCTRYSNPFDATNNICHNLFWKIAAWSLYATFPISKFSQYSSNIEHLCEVQPFRGVKWAPLAGDYCPEQ